jgi:hypothetical protein
MRSARKTNGHRLTQHAGTASPRPVSRAQPWPTRYGERRRRREPARWIAPALAACAVLTIGSGSARADAEEVSLHLEAAGGLALVGDRMAPEQAASAALGGLGLRGTYATHDWFAFDLAAAYLQTGTVEYRMVESGSGSAGLLREFRLLQVEGGASLRLGVRVIPILGLALGYQHRTARHGRLVRDNIGLDSVEDAVHHDVLATARAGLDWRLNRHWIVGAAGRATQAINAGPEFGAIELLLHASYYWYP